MTDWIIANGQKELTKRRRQLGIDARVTRRESVFANLAAAMPTDDHTPQDDTQAPRTPQDELQLPERVKVYPTSAGAFLGQNPKKPTRTLASVGRVHCLVRAYDTQGTGKIKLDRAREVITQATNMTRRNLRGILQQGNGLAWDIAGEDIYIYSPARVALALGSGSLKGKPVYVPVADLCGGIQQVKATLYATYHGGRRRSNPITRRAIRELTGIPERTQVRYDKVAGVKVRYNVGTANEDPTEENYHRRAWEKGRAAFKLFDIKRNKTVIAWRLPNSYDAAYEQAPRGRQRKHNRKINLVIQRQPGNDSDIVRTYHPTARIAARYALDTPDSDHYYPTGTTSTFAANKPTKTRGVDVWATMQ